MNMMESSVSSAGAAGDMLSMDMPSDEKKSLRGRGLHLPDMRSGSTNVKAGAMAPDSP